MWGYASTLGVEGQINMSHKNLKSRVTRCGRVCIECGKWKQWKNFHKDNNGFNGRNRICKHCASLRVTEYRKRTNYYETHREQILASKKTTYYAKGRKIYNLNRLYGMTLQE